MQSAQHDINARRDYLTLLVRTVIREHGLWGESTETGIHPQSEFGKALTQLIEAFEIGDIPESCRPLERIVTPLADEWEAYRSRVESTGNEKTPAHRTFWSLFEQLLPSLDQAEVAEFPNLPNPATLRADETGKTLTPLQIARMYDWKDSRGEYDQAKVMNELANPSKEYANGVPDPRNVKRSLDRKIQNDRIADSISKQEKHRKQLESVAPEPTEDLILQGVSAAQICRMKKITLAELQRFCKDHGLTMPGVEKRKEPAVAANAKVEDSVDLNDPESSETRDAIDDALMADGSGATVSDDETDDEVYELQGDGLSIEEQVILTHGKYSHLTATQIGELFDLTANKVGRILKRRNEIMGGAAVANA